MKDELNKLVERMKGYRTKSRLLSNESLPATRIAGYYAGMVDGIELVLASLIVVMEGNENG